MSAAFVPSPSRGGLGRGWGSMELAEKPIPHPTSPLNGEERARSAA